MSIERRIEHRQRNEQQHLGGFFKCHLVKTSTHIQRDISMPKCRGTPFSQRKPPKLEKILISKEIALDFPPDFWSLEGTVRAEPDQVVSGRLQKDSEKNVRGGDGTKRNWQNFFPSTKKWGAKGAIFFARFRAHLPFAFALGTEGTTPTQAIPPLKRRINYKGLSDYVKKLTLRDTNTTETVKIGLQQAPGLQPWTAVSFLLELVSTVWQTPQEYQRK